MKRLIPVFLMLILVSAPVYADNLQDGNDAYDQGDYKTTFDKWETLAEQGNAKAQFRLGHEYKFTCKDCKKARKWMQAAIDQNYPNAIEEMGFWYRWEGGVCSSKFQSNRLKKEADLQVGPIFPLILPTK